MGAKAQPYAVANGALAAAPAPATYYGFSLGETTGAAPAKVRIRNGSAAGTILDTVALVSSETAREYYSNGIYAKDGIYVEVIVGSVEGSVRVG